MKSPASTSTCTPQDPINGTSFDHGLAKHEESYATSTFPHIVLPTDKKLSRRVSLCQLGVKRPFSRWQVHARRGERKKLRENPPGR